MHQPKIHQPRIVLVAGIILVVVTLMAGIGVFVVMERQTEDLLSKSLQVSLQNRIQLVKAEIDTVFGKTTVAATRPQFISLVQLANASVDVQANQATLANVVQSFLPTGLTAISVFGKDGRQLAQAGTFAQKPAMAVPLNLPGRVQLLWDGRLLLHVTAEMKQGGGGVGTVMTEAPLPVTWASLNDAGTLGQMGETALCATSGTKIQCAPTTLTSTPFVVPLVSADGQPLPMAYALDGKTGFTSRQDYRNQQVEAAYAPVGDLGLGMVLKIDSANLYAPVWRQLRYLIPLMLVMLGVALLALRWLLTPLVVGLQQSEKQAHDMSNNLRNSELLFRQLFETSMEGILQTRPDGQITNANAAACDLFGLTVEQMAGLGRTSVVDMSDPRLPPLLEERKTKGRARGELRMRRADGSLIECELSSAIFPDANGEPCANILLRDITERKIAQDRIAQLNAELEQRVEERTAQLDASNRELQEFTQSVAHDLRQPFIAIGGFVGLLERVVDNETKKHYVNRIKEGVKQASVLTDGLLKLASLSRVELRLREVDLSAMATDVMEKLQQKDPARVCQIHIEPGLRAQADATLMREVMEELLDNAWKYSSRKACTEISFRREAQVSDKPDGDTVYVVSDNGVGFDMAHADKLFRSFQRLHSPQEFPGAGGDLAKTQRIVSRHGGHIWANSAPGEGASFYFSLGHT
jgi:PAS domain S-box-containing protein